MLLKGKNALHIAAQENRNNVIEALVTATNVSIDQKAHDGKTAFRLASIEGIKCGSLFKKSAIGANCGENDKSFK